jgi:hypothetical protein
MSNINSSCFYCSFSAFCEALNISNRTNKEFEIALIDISKPCFWIHPVSSSLDYGAAEVYMYLLGKPFAYTGIVYT